VVKRDEFSAFGLAFHESFDMRADNKNGPLGPVDARLLAERAGFEPAEGV
jgi:hypothetical protein